MGIVSPVGSRIDDAWRNVCEGNSGIGLVEEFDASTYTTRIAGSVKGFALTLFIGILTSMFTAIVGTRSIVEFIYGRRARAPSKLSI